jgi:predicted ABC-type exoprotein transport system permease subunit
MRVLGRLALPVWLFVLGAIVMYVFFVAVASIPPAQVASVTVVVAVLTLLFFIRSMRVASELADRGGNPALRRELNRARERRGF